MFAPAFGTEIFEKFRFESPSRVAEHIRCVRMNDVEKRAMEAQRKPRELPVSRYNLDTYFGRVRVASSHSLG
jgi:hypothetical protein